MCEKKCEASFVSICKQFWMTYENEWENFVLKRIIPARRPMQGINQLFAPALVEVGFPRVSLQESGQPSLSLGIWRNGGQPPLSRGSMRFNPVAISSVLVDFVTQTHEGT